ncbi:hypothetical protein B0H14DRAFT_3455512 [Mycena olivaceomarginata]|nr:hypothetical protein B0H14DRAFT_3455512 [Mycena olivaceomarginata]
MHPLSHHLPPTDLLLCRAHLLRASLLRPRTPLPDRSATSPPRTRSTTSTPPASTPPASSHSVSTPSSKCRPAPPSSPQRRTSRDGRPPPSVSSITPTSPSGALHPPPSPPPPSGYGRRDGFGSISTAVVISGFG